MYKNSFWNLFFGVVIVLCACTTIRYNTTNIPNKSIKIDSTITNDLAAEALILPYRQKLETQMNRIIGYSKATLTKNEGENLLGNFVADAIRAEASVICKKQIDMAAINNGGLRNIIAKGPIKVNDMFELMPFENELVLLEIKGSLVYKLFELQAQLKKTSVANSKVKITNGKPVEILIGNIPLDTNKTYTIAMSDYMASSEIPILKNEKAMNLGIKIRDLLIVSVQKTTAANDSINPKIEGRFIEQ